MKDSCTGRFLFLKKEREKNLPLANLGLFFKEPWPQFDMQQLDLKTWKRTKQPTKTLGYNLSHQD